MPSHSVASSQGLGLRQFKAVMKKNLLLKRRRPFESLLELFSPMFFCFLIVAFYNASTVHREDTTVYAGQFMDVGALVTLAKDAVARGSNFSEQVNQNCDYRTLSILPIARAVTVMNDACATHPKFTQSFLEKNAQQHGHAFLSAPSNTSLLSFPPSPHHHRRDAQHNRQPPRA